MITHQHTCGNGDYNTYCRAIKWGTGKPSTVGCFVNNAVGGGDYNHQFSTNCSLLEVQEEMENQSNAD